MSIDSLEASVIAIRTTVKDVVDQLSALVLDSVKVLSPTLVILILHYLFELISFHWNVVD